MFYLISDLVLTAILILFIGIIFIFCFLPLGPKYDKKKTTFRERALTALGCLGIIIFLSSRAYSQVFPDRWNCPDCEQVNNYYDHLFQTPRMIQWCRGCDGEFEGRKLEPYKSSKPFYSLP